MISNYLRFSVDLSLVLQEEVHHLYVAIVTGDMQRSVPHLQTEGASSKRKREGKDYTFSEAVISALV